MLKEPSRSLRFFSDNLQEICDWSFENSPNLYESVVDGCMELVGGYETAFPALPDCTDAPASTTSERG